jgi:hypothetical protein
MNEAREQISKLQEDAFYEGTALRVARMTLIAARETHSRDLDFESADKCTAYINLFDERLRNLAEAEAVLAEEARLILEP